MLFLLNPDKSKRAGLIWSHQMLKNARYFNVSPYG